MVLIQRQKIFSWFDSYNVFDESGNVVFMIKGRLAWGHKLEIYDAFDNYLGKIQEKVITFLPQYRFFIGENEVGCLRKKLTFFKPKFELDYNGWQVKGNVLEWNYEVRSQNGLVMTCDKKLLRITDTYRLDIVNDNDALLCLMIALSIDIDKCSRGNT